MGSFYIPIQQTPLTPLHWNYKWKTQTSLQFVPANKYSSRKAGWVCAEEPWLCLQAHAFKCPWTLASSTVTLCPVFQILLHIKHRLAAGHVSLLRLISTLSVNCFSSNTMMKKRWNKCKVVENNKSLEKEKYCMGYCFKTWNKWYIFRKCKTWCVRGLCHCYLHYRLLNERISLQKLLFYSRSLVDLFFLCSKSCLVPGCVLVCIPVMAQSIRDRKPFGAMQEGLGQ